MSYISERNGRCYELAFNYIMEEMDPQAVLVHGSILRADSKRIDHAWVEYLDTHEIIMIWEPIEDWYFSEEEFEIHYKPIIHHKYHNYEVKDKPDCGPWE